MLEEACGDISFLPNLLFCFSLAPPSLVMDSISGSFVTEICINILKLRPDMTSIFDLLVEQEISGGNHLGSRQCRSTPSLWCWQRGRDQWGSESQHPPGRLYNQFLSATSRSPSNRETWNIKMSACQNVIIISLFLQNFLSVHRLSVTRNIFHFKENPQPTPLNQPGRTSAGHLYSLGMIRHWENVQH